MKLRNRVAIVTGAGSGIGKATAIAFAREGATVAVNDINYENAKQVLDDVKHFSANSDLFVADVGNYQEVSQMVDKVFERYGKIDILINNAGIAVVKPSEELSPEDWTHTINTNLNSVFFCSRAVVKYMIRNGGGKIVNMSSLTGLSATSDRLGYIASKHGVIGITKGLAVEWGKYNIRVNCICPGITLTPMVENNLKALEPESYEERLKRIPLGRPATPEDQAQAVLYLASEESEYLTGVILPVDGGTMVRHPGF